MMMSEMDEDPRPLELTAERRETPRRMPRGRIWVAAVALFAFAGFTWYAYRQATKAGEEGVAPLIKAEAGPSRVKPDEPGGMDVPDQDKSVYGRVGSDQPSSTKVESLLPEPEKPMSPPAAATAASPSVTVASTTTSPPAETKAGAPTQTAAIPAPPPPSAAEAKAAAHITPAAGTPGPAESAKAPPPPPAAASETKTAAATPGPEASPSKSMASGSHHVQLAALRSEAAANDEWKKLQKAYPDLLGSLSPNIVKVDLGDKGTFYRLQAGALSEAAAKKLCEDMKSRKAGCIVGKS